LFYLVKGNNTFAQFCVLHVIYYAIVIVLLVC